VKILPLKPWMSILNETLEFIMYG